MNWVIFFLIFGSLLCRPNARKEASNNDKLRRLEENFMIALGLSLLFGLGWAFGLLASSHLPPAVRYPAEWLFTLLNAFLGVYLFVLYVVRSPEARKVWKRWICCESRKVDVTRTSTRRTWTSTLRSWGGTLKRSKKGRKDTDTLTRSGNAASANVYSISNQSRVMSQMESSYAEPSSMMGVTTPTSPPPVEIEMRRIDPEGQSNTEEIPKSVTPPVLKLGADTESIVETMDFEDNSSLLNFNAPSVNSTSSLSHADADCYIVQNKGTDEGPDCIHL